MMPIGNTSVYKYLASTFSPIEDENKTKLAKIISLVIVLSILTVVLESEKIVFEQFIYVFPLLELFFGLFFAIEYIFRLIFSGTDNRYRGFKGKLKYALTPIAIIDFLAFAPALLLLNTTDPYLLRIFRLLRLLRIIKFAANNPAVSLFLLALKNSRVQLTGSLIVTLFVLFIGAIFLYIAEGKIQPEQFGSIPRAMWWSMATLTTVGYGDVFPVTVIGKCFASLIAILGIGIVALPAGIIAANYSKVLDENEVKK